MKMKPAQLIALSTLILALGGLTACGQKNEAPAGDETTATETMQPAETTVEETPPPEPVAEMAEESQQETAPSAVAQLEPKSDSSVSGTVTFTRQSGEGSTLVTLQVAGLTPGNHGFHIHENGDCSSPDGTSAGSHYNPAGVEHGAPDNAVHHAGDMGNIVADENGNANTQLSFDFLSFEGENSIIGKAVIIHGGEDDLTSQPSGAAGARVACGIISLAGNDTGNENIEDM